VATMVLRTGIGITRGIPRRTTVGVRAVKTVESMQIKVCIIIEIKQRKINPSRLV
jgi:hypothetical protein